MRKNDDFIAPVVLGRRFFDQRRRRRGLFARRARRKRPGARINLLVTQPAFPQYVGHRLFNRMRARQRANAHAVRQAVVKNNRHLRLGGKQFQRRRQFAFRDGEIRFLQILRAGVRGDCRAQDQGGEGRRAQPAHQALPRDALLVSAAII